MNAVILIAGGQVLTTEDMRILAIVLAEYSAKLKDAGINLESESSEPSSITKESVVLCLKATGLEELADILSRKEGNDSYFAFFQVNI